MARRQRRILLVDDEAAVQFSYERLLQGEGFAVDACGTLEEALACIDEHRYDAALLDLRLSHSEGCEGLEILQYVRQRQPEAQVIFMTGFGNDEIREEVLALGVVRYLVKPVQVAEILDLVSALVPPDPERQR